MPIYVRYYKCTSPRSRSLLPSPSLRRLLQQRVQQDGDGDDDADEAPESVHARRGVRRRDGEVEGVEQTVGGSREDEGGHGHPGGCGRRCR